MASKTSSIALSLFAYIFILLSFIPYSFASDNPPHHIISLAPSITESLYALGLEDSVIGISIYCPAGNTRKEHIGTIWEPNVEKILSLSPDLVLATKEGNKKGDVLKLIKLGIPVVTVESDRNFNDICDNFLQIGRSVGKEKKAREIIAAAKARIKAVQDRVSGKNPVRTFWEVGAKPLFTVSAGSFIDDFCRYTGCSNIFSDIKIRYPRISREEVVRRDPEAILLVSMGDVTEAELRSWAAFPELGAVRSERVFIIKSSDIFTPTPLTFAKGVEIIAGLLHPNEK